MYNPSDVARKGSLFGLPYQIEDAQVVILPVGHDVTTSLKDGTSKASEAILEASSQLDLSLPTIDKPWELRTVMAPDLVESKENARVRTVAKKLIERQEAGIVVNKEDLQQVNQYCDKLYVSVQERCAELLEKGAMVGILGGEHSSPLGLMAALSERFEMGILQIDAHMDLRSSYEGFTHSHASIMYNAMQLEGVRSLTQVGIRDYCEEEEHFVQDATKPVTTFYDELMAAQRSGGVTWKEQVDEIVQTLPDVVYVSFDVDGLEPSLCPGTGTPVPGGLTYNQGTQLLQEVVRSGRKIIGFDLCEVGSDCWDANVGARVLYRLATLAGLSNGLLSWK